jgi:hypothetical protein
MKASLRTLLAGLIDYAGLFPPAQLPLEETIANYARYRQEPEAWMLGRFICPAAKLKNLSAFHDDLFSSGPAFAFAVLGPNHASWPECRDGMKEALQSLQAFRNRHGGHVAADVLEMKVPTDIVEASDLKGTAARLIDIRAIIEAAGFKDLTVFFENGFDRGERAVATVIEAISIYNRDAPPRAGFKLRCGGLEASAFPTAEQIAFVIRNAIMNGVPLKATAGLHHPFPRFDAAVGTKMHGFVNVFGAGVLAYAQYLEPTLMVGLLRDENRGHFVFDKTGFHYGTLHATTAEIAAARQEGVISFGSCSFDEPRDDLRTVGWL